MKARESIVIKLVFLFLFSLVVMLSYSVFVVEANELYPTKSINLVVPWNAGGTTDLLNRILASQMEKALGKKILVSNITGSGGGIAIQHVRDLPADGYTLLGYSHSLLLLGTMNRVKDNMNWYNWYWFIGGTAITCITVKADSPIQSVTQLINEARKRPGKIKIGHCGVGGPEYNLFKVIESVEGIKFNLIGYPGAAATVKAVLSGEIDAAGTMLSEPVEFARAGKVKMLTQAYTEPVEVADVGVIPSIGESLPKMKDFLPIVRYNGFVVKRNTPAEALIKLEEAFKYAMKQESTQKFMAEKLIKPEGIFGVESDRLISKIASYDTWGLVSVGIAVNSPAKFGIPSPEEWQWPPLVHPTKEQYIPWPSE